MWFHYFVIHHADNVYEMFQRDCVVYPLEKNTQSLFEQGRFFFVEPMDEYRDVADDNHKKYYAMLNSDLLNTFFFTFFEAQYTKCKEI